MNFTYIMIVGLLMNWWAIQTHMGGGRRGLGDIEKNTASTDVRLKRIVTQRINQQKQSIICIIRKKTYMEEKKTKSKSTKNIISCIWWLNNPYICVIIYTLKHLSLDKNLATIQAIIGINVHTYATQFCYFSVTCSSCLHVVYYLRLCLL